MDLLSLGYHLIIRYRPLYTVAAKPSMVRKVHVHIIALLGRNETGAYLDPTRLEL